MRWFFFQREVCTYVPFGRWIFRHQHRSPVVGCRNSRGSARYIVYYIYSMWVLYLAIRRQNRCRGTEYVDKERQKQGRGSAGIKATEERKKEMYCKFYMYCIGRHRFHPCFRRPARARPFSLLPQPPVDRRIDDMAGLHCLSTSLLLEKRKKETKRELSCVCVWRSK